MTLLERFTTTLELNRYEDIREALFHPDLSRTFDRRSYAEGNIRDGIVSVQHGAIHRARRRVENTQFRADTLRLYEHELFPRVMETLLDRLLVGVEVDLYPVSELLAAALACRRAGLDVDPSDVSALERIVGIVDTLSQGSAILDARDPDAVRALVYATYEELERDFVAPARARRESLLARHERGEIGDHELTQDILTVLLRHAHDPALELDTERVTREMATYLQGGTHTSGQVAVNALDLLFTEGGPADLDRLADDLLFAQRVVHETLRLRPTTPRAKRRVEVDAIVAGRAVPADSLVVLDLARGNRDPDAYGPDADRFDPDREIPSGAPRWGLSFGAGAHQCPGRSVGGGFPIPWAAPVGEDHLYGLVARMVQAYARRGVRPHPQRPPVPDTRTDRYTRWAHYWVRLDASRGAALSR
jgi:benzoate 4-monooxygenase